MVRLVTFDLYQTLCYSDPSRNARLARLLCELGHPCQPEDFLRPNVAAEEMYTLENGRHPLHVRSADEQFAFYTAMYGLLLREAGLRHDPAFAAEVRRAMVERQGEARWRLFDDVLPTLSALRGRGLSLGVISNTPLDATVLCTELGVCERVDFVVSSSLVGCEKPCRRIFQAALDQAGVEPSDAVHVGDQPRSDVLGARGAGMHALLLDRDDLLGHEEFARIASLTELIGWVDRTHAA